MSSPDPKTPGDGSPPPEEDEHGAKISKFFSELEQEVSGSVTKQPRDQDDLDPPV